MVSSMDYNKIIQCDCVLPFAGFWPSLCLHMWYSLVYVSQIIYSDL